MLTKLHSITNRERRMLVGWIECHTDAATDDLKSVTGSFYSGKAAEDGTAVSHKASTVTAEKELALESGKDTDILGSKASGEKVTADIGGNLTIESLQDRNDYDSKSRSASAGVATGIDFGHTSASAGISQGKIDSNYRSVTEQTGIYAGSEGFDINVEKSTDLKGAVIASEAPAEKNSLTTGTLTWSDIANEADYKAGGIGITYATKDHALNEKGFTPSITPTVKDDADSMTKSGVAEGKITITGKEKQKQDIGQMNRETENALNKLQEIFDKDHVQEKQEFLSLLAKTANEGIHELSRSKGWEDGSKEKIALHAIVGGLLVEMGSSDFTGGALAAGVNEYVIGYLSRPENKESLAEHPDEVQWLSALIGGVASGIVGGDVSSGAGVALAGTKWNLELDAHATQIRESIKSELVERFSQEYQEQLNEAIYSVSEGEEALVNLTKYYAFADEPGFPMAKDLLGLFLDQNPSAHGITDVSFTNDGYKMYRFGRDSALNRNLRSYDKLNAEIVRRSIENVASSGVAIPTYVDSYEFYTTGVDAGLALGRATAITSFRFSNDGKTIEAKITIMDNWNHSKAYADLGWFYNDAYVVQQSKLRPAFGYETTYDVVLKVSDVFPDREYEK